MRLTSPYLGAVARSMAAMLAAAALTWYLVSPTATMWVAAAGAIAGASALQDSPFGRIPAVLAVSVYSGIAVLVGALTGGNPILFVAVVAVWCFAAGMCWAVGADAGLTAAAVALLVVVAPSVAPAIGEAAATAVLAIAAGCMQAALVAMRPPRPWRARREATSAALASLGADAQRLATGLDIHVDEAPVRELRETFDRTSSRRPSPAQRDSYRLPERIAATLFALGPAEDAADGPVARTLTAAADALTAAAGTGRHVRQRAEEALQRLQVAATEVDGIRSAAARRLTDQIRDAVALRFGRLHQRSLRDSAAAIRAELVWPSPVLRHALRVAGATAVAVAAGRFGGLDQGHWLALTVLLVLRPETAHTYTRCGGRIGGIAIGVAVASVPIVLWQPSGLVAAAIAAALVALTYTVLRYGFVAVSAALGAAIMFLLGIAGLGTPTTFTGPAFAVVLGGALALVAHVVVPDDGLVRLRQRAGELLKTEIDYAALVVKAFVHDLDRPAEVLAAVWQRAFRARAAFEAASGVTRVDSHELRRWLRSYRAAVNAVTGACAALETNLPSQPSAALSREFVAAVDEYIDALRGSPPSPAAAWTVDIAALTAADQRVREVAGRLPPDDRSARVLVAELGTITRSLEGIASSREPTSAG
ncbi:FUSC family protein [Mycolicibacterium thermoresistibile]